MARHGCAQMTRRYSRSRKPRHHELTDPLGLTIRRTRGPQECRGFAEEKPLVQRALLKLLHTAAFRVNLVAGAGFAPGSTGTPALSDRGRAEAETGRKRPQAALSGDLAESHRTQADVAPGHPGREKCTRYADPALAEVVNAWAKLPEHVRQDILARVRGALPDHLDTETDE